MILLLVLRRRWEGVQGRQILGALGRVVAATSFMGVAVLGVLALGQGAGIGAFGVVTLGAVTGAVVYVGTGVPLGVEALRWPLDALVKR